VASEGRRVPGRLPGGKVHHYISVRMNPNPPPPPYPSSGAGIPPASNRGGDPADASLLQRMAAGDELALGTLYDRWHQLVHAVVARIVRGRGEIDDVVEEAFWQAWRQASRFDQGRGSVRTWLLTIARSRALDRVRAVKRLHEEPLDGEHAEVAAQATAESDPGRDAEATERRVVVLAALAELPPEQREALELGYFGGLSQSEIAERTGQPLGTIKTRIRLAMQKLRGRLQILREDAR
jgi:RNA polymerase sigma-70 factor (ECF subfamily)